MEKETAARCEKMLLAARREAARKSCVSLAAMAAMPKAPEPPVSQWGIAIIAVIVAAVVAVATVFTAGAAGGAIFTAMAVATLESSMLASTASALVSVGIGVAAGGVAAGISAGINELAAPDANGKNKYSTEELTGHYEVKDFNYRETVSTSFEWDTLVCHKCVRSQICADTRKPMFGKPNCRRWSDVNETCTDIEF